jgi:hypothetical protein
VVGAARYEGTHPSDNQQLLVEGWHLGEDKVPAPPPCAERRRNARAGSQHPPAAQAVLDPTEDVVMQDAEVEPDDEPPAFCFERLQEDLTSLATLVACRLGVLVGGDTLLSAADYADLPGKDESSTPLTDAELVQLVLSDNAPGLVDVHACVSAGVLRPALRADVGRLLRAPWGPGPDAARELGRPSREGWRTCPLLGRLHLGGAPGA